MKLTQTEHPTRDETVWVLILTGADLSSAHIKPFDRMVLEDCAKPDATISDTLLGLELLTRRIEEASTIPRAHSSVG